MSTARKPWFGPLAALLAISAGAGVQSVAVANPVAHSPRGAGTTGAAASAGGGATKLAAGSPAGFASGDLSTVERAVLHGGYVVSGIGMRNLGHGTLVIKGIPVGAKVVSAILMWDILDLSRKSTFPMGVFAGHSITGKFWASGRNPCWSGAAHNFSYDANVTSFVTGNGRYNVHGFASGQTDGRDPFRHGSIVPMLEGATLIVVYQKASMARVVIQIAQGAFESQASRLLHATLSGFTARRNGSVKTTYIVADGQLKGNKARFNGHTLAIGFPGASPQARRPYLHGDLWDTVSVTVTKLVKAGARSATMGVVAPRQRRLGGGSDCIVWVGQVLSVRVR